MSAVCRRRHAGAFCLRWSTATRTHHALLPHHEFLLLKSRPIFVLGDDLIHALLRERRKTEVLLTHAELVEEIEVNLVVVLLEHLHRIERVVEDGRDFRTRSVSMRVFCIDRASVMLLGASYDRCMEACMDIDRLYKARQATAQ